MEYLAFHAGLNSETPFLKVIGMKKYLLLPILLLLVYIPVVHAQSLDIPVEGYGISFGNSKNFTGLRFNLLDSDVEKINGLNVIVGLPIFGQLPKTVTGVYNGLSLGLMGNGAKRVNGIMIGTLGTFVDDEITGILTTGLINGAEGRVGRENNPLFGRVTNKITGVAICGGACTARTLNGIIFSGVATAAEEKINGIAIGGLMVGTKRLPDDGSKTGGEINGIAIGGLFTSTDRMNGIQIGIFNYAKELNGIQIGLINYAGNNSPGLQWLPLINAHFSF
jgi:hypothetical protein